MLNYIGAYKYYWGGEHEAKGIEMLPMLPVDWQASAVWGEEAGYFREIAGMSIATVGGPHSAVDSFNCRQPSGLHKL